AVRIGPVGPNHATDIVIDNVPVRYGWLLASIEDRSGNSIQLRYTTLGPTQQAPSATEQVLSEIDYTGSMAGTRPALRPVRFISEPRLDPYDEFVTGLRLWPAWRISRLDMVAPNPTEPKVVRHYDFSYAPSTTSRSLLTSVRECDGATPPVCRPPNQFEYQ